MTLNELKKYTSQGEGLHIEFKKKANFPDKIVREMVAFANTKGGFLFVGIDDDKTISGCKNPEEDIFVLTKHLASYSPFLVYSLERLPINAKREVLAFHVPESAKKPVYLKQDAPPFKLSAFVRVADMSIVASKEMVQVLRYASDMRDVKFMYGKREEAILRYLQQQPRITLAEAQQLLNLPQKPAAIALVTLVRADLLLIHATEHGDYFSLNEAAFR